MYVLHRTIMTNKKKKLTEEEKDMAVFFQMFMACKLQANGWTEEEIDSYLEAARKGEYAEGAE